MATSFQSRYNAPGVACVASGTQPASNSPASGSEPSRRRAWKIADFDGIFHCLAHPDCHDSPSTRLRITSSYEACENNANPST